MHDLQVRQNLTGMLFIGQRIDGGQSAVLRKLLDVRLRIRPDHGSVNHASEHTRGVPDRFAPAQLRVGTTEEHDAATQFANPYLKADSRTCRRFVKDQRPALIADDLGGGGAILSQRRAKLHNVGDFLRRKCFDGQEILHK